MNAPLLPPLTPCPAPDSAGRAVVAQKFRPQWQAGFSAIANDEEEPFFRPCDPLPLPDAQFLAISPGACELLGANVDALINDPSWLAILSGQASPDTVQPYATVYAGHQFGAFVPRLGDGRALNLGSLSGWELQLKGAGPTHYSRFADGRAVLRSSIREFLCSEAMHALGIPSTRALSLVMSSAPVLRETAETAAIVCRLSPHFVRIGQFEYFAARNRADLLHRLLRWAAPFQLGERDLAAMPADALSVEFLNDVSRKTAELMAQWMSVGFMHGVMNTDNFSVLGLTLDYGPFGFMDSFDANHICNHSDHSGRYAYQAQPQVGLWNIAKLASALYSLCPDAEKLQQSLEIFKKTYACKMESLLREKMGLKHLLSDQWESLLDNFYDLLQAQKMDYTLSFRALCSQDNQDFLGLAFDREAAQAWLSQYRKASDADSQISGQSPQERLSEMKRINPKYVLRNWIAEEVIRSVRDEGDSKVFQEVFTVLQNPFEEHAQYQRFASPPPDWAHQLSVSCSS